MPKLKRRTSQVADSGFSVYAGDEPRVGVYRGILKQLSMRKSSNDNYMYNTMVEFTNNDGLKAQYDGYPAWLVITLSDKDGNLRREKNFYRAIGVSEDSEVDFIETNAKKDAGKIRKIGHKTLQQILGTEVLVQMRMEVDNRDGSSRVRADSIYPAQAKSENAVNPDEESEDEDITEDEGEEEEYVDEPEDEEDDSEAREAALNAMTLPKLRQEAKKLQIAVAGLKKAALVEAILDAEADAEGEEDEETDGEGPVLSTYSGLTLVKLKKQVVSDFEEYDAEDLEGMKKDEILDMLVEDGLVIDDGDEEPPF